MSKWLRFRFRLRSVPSSSGLLFISPWCLLPLFRLLLVVEVDGRASLLRTWKGWEDAHGTNLMARESWSRTKYFRMCGCPPPPPAAVGNGVDAPEIGRADDGLLLGFIWPRSWNCPTLCRRGDDEATWLSKFGCWTSLCLSPEERKLILDYDLDGKGNLIRAWWGVYVDLKLRILISLIHSANCLHCYQVGLRGCVDGAHCYPSTKNSHLRVPSAEIIKESQVSKLSRISARSQLGSKNEIGNSSNRKRMPRMHAFLCPRRENNNFQFQLD